MLAYVRPPASQGARLKALLRQSVDRLEDLQLLCKSGVSTLLLPASPQRAWVSAVKTDS